MLPERSLRHPRENLLLVAGLLLVVLGIGNWIVGATRARPYAEYLGRQPEPTTRAKGLKAQLLEPPDEEREERNVSRAKLEFYELVRIGGRSMVVVGALCLLVGALGASDPRVRRLRAASSSGGRNPP